MTSFKPCLLIPVYNHERALATLLDGLRPHGLPCILVDDGSSPESARVLDTLAEREAGWVHLVRHPVNQGKGGAVMTGVREAAVRGYTHALQIDADGQHDPVDVPRFLAASEANPEALVCGAPVFDESVPKARLWGRVLTNVWVWINSLSLQVKDGLCGYRLYPLAPLVALFSRAKLGSRMDFDPELLVRLKWDGLEMVSLPVRVRYPLDGTSHFRMGLDNWLISKMHTRLFFGMLVRLPRLLLRRGRAR
jgi:glycosyltransferase involved in cell wall biosynthesis